METLKSIYCTGCERLKPEFYKGLPNFIETYEEKWHGRRTGHCFKCRDYLVRSEMRHMDKIIRANRKADARRKD